MLQKNVSLYTKPGCSLCDKALLRINNVRSAVPFHLEVIDITRSSKLIQKHGLHIPVVFLDGIEIFRYYVNEEGLRELLLKRPV